MMEVTIDSKGRRIQDFIIFKGLLKQHKKSILVALTAHGKRVTDALHDIIVTGTRSGRTYTYKGNKYVASAPGEPPATRSGRLADSFGSERSLRQLKIFSDAFSDNGYEYPWRLEMKMNRPYFRKVIEAQAPILRRMLNKVAKEKVA